MPGYADLISVTFFEDGATARIEVAMAKAIPSALGGDEVEGVGVNLYAQVSQPESDYQLFADGGPDGWFAYLQGPGGFVKYPGTFVLDEARMIFEVPWSSLGNLTGTAFDAFADWSQTVVAVNRNGQDHLPEAGRATFAR